MTPTVVNPGSSVTEFRKRILATMVIYFADGFADRGASGGENQYSAGEITSTERTPLMGDKNPKSTQKHASQKEVKVSGKAQQKQQLAAAQAATKTKLAANKKK
ncbi:MAG: hypothetical protein ABI680_06575 [Chthoniobacteraceae bacterium]